eukprot:SAG11_NODE_28217_length_324_cov_0.822222_1_plen_31_part_10
MVEPELQLLARLQAATRPALMCNAGSPVEWK